MVHPLDGLDELSGPMGPARRRGGDCCGTTNCLTGPLTIDPVHYPMSSDQASELVVESDLQHLQVAIESERVAERPGHRPILQP